MSPVKKLAAVIRMMPSKRYLNYIRSPQWWSKRNAHLLLVGGWCEICRIRKACQVHHWHYRTLGAERPCDLCAVCPQCHHDIHCAVMPAANDNQIQLDLFKTGSGQQLRKGVVWRRSAHSASLRIMPPARSRPAAGGGA
jgi:hypothetical protein